MEGGPNSTLSHLSSTRKDLPKSRWRPSQKKKKSYMLERKKCLFPCEPFRRRPGFSSSMFGTSRIDLPKNIIIKREKCFFGGFKTIGSPQRALLENYGIAYGVADPLHIRTKTSCGLTKIP